MKNLDFEYSNIIRDILNNEDFSKMAYIEHHDTTRLDHMMKVSYYSYKVAKILKLKYREAARAGLLHDFYYSRTVDYKNFKDKLMLYTSNHPKEALLNSKKNFNINDIEADIILTHMFPVNMNIPKYLESWIVSFVDKGVAAFEFYRKAINKLKYTFGLKYIIVLNILK